jgi:ATP-dependent Clp protease ATP-binding subunit ClpC
MNTDSILKRLERVQKIIVEPTSVEETITILNNIKNKYEDHRYLLTRSIEACVKPDRYMSEFYRTRLLTL